MYDSFNRVRNIIRLSIHKDNNDMVNKPIQIHKYKFEDYHYKAISILQEYYGQKLNTSNIQRKQIIRHKLEFLDIIKGSQFYTTANKLRLNKMREEYLLSKKSSKNDT